MSDTARAPYEDRIVTAFTAFAVVGLAVLLVGAALLVGLRVLARRRVFEG